MNTLWFVKNYVKSLYIEIIHKKVYFREFFLKQCKNDIEEHLETSTFVRFHVKIGFKAKKEQVVLSFSAHPVEAAFYSFFQSYYASHFTSKKEMRFQIGIQLLCTISRLFYVCMMLKENPLWRGFKVKVAKNWRGLILLSNILLLLLRL